MLNLLSSLPNAGPGIRVGKYQNTGVPDGSVDRTSTEKKKNGIFYTPDRATKILAQWAIRASTNKVLEPSFGGCGFLAAARDQLNACGSDRPEWQLYGCDRDTTAFSYLSTLFHGMQPSGHFRQGDFLETGRSAFGNIQFDVVMGNPPYVSLHNMSDEQREAARRAADLAGVPISKKASLWAYFVIHSLPFLASDGRMAWVLPGSFLHSDYSVALREKLALSFRRSLAVQLEERLFLAEGTEESSVILLCEGYGSRSTTSNIELTRAANLGELESIIAEWGTGALVGTLWSERTQLELLPKDTRELWEAISRRDHVCRLGKHMIFRIGIVTGANKFFVIDRRTAVAHDLPDEVLQPILARFSQCRGLNVTSADLEEVKRNGERCLLFDTARIKKVSDPVAAYMEELSTHEREKNRTFSKRAYWHQPNDGLTPDGFFSAMQTDGPTLVLNGAGVTCTNTVYRVSFQPEVSERHRRFLAVAVQSTISQVSAEIEGRSYGSGGLKLEPSESARILVCLPECVKERLVSDAFFSVDRLLRTGDRTAARQIADQLLLSIGVVTREELAILNTALGKLRDIRRGSRRRGTQDQ